ncbi:MAG TPA: biotin--[acetyl-CoA-carboxylase] ligase [Planctomycetes bacterium]|nr:biotin--[acetyl-CoA-carboxylase] ligase [Planctomycetota bacterium]HIJ69804.1 biotin--[acetyl-CoA-carboxylase] ligase [Planctomycetota bacterium]
MLKSDQLDVDAIKSSLQTAGLGKEILIYKATTSTNDIAWEYAANRKNNGLCIFAEHQTAGRGRGANEWLAGAGDSILCSTLLFDCKCGAELLTLAAAVATAQAVNKCSQLDARLKWPNDIIIKGKKVAGILLESKAADDSFDYVIGVGINCHQNEVFFQRYDFRMEATSIDIQSDMTVDRNLLAAELIVSLDEWLDIAQNDSRRITHTWSELSSQLGHRITVEYNQKKFTGNCIGVDPAKGLILQLDDGGVRMFDAAHTTIVKHM